MLSALCVIVRKSLQLTSCSGYGGIPTRQNATPFIGQLNLFCRGIPIGGFGEVTIKMCIKQFCFERFILDRVFNLGYPVFFRPLASFPLFGLPAVPSLFPRPDENPFSSSTGLSHYSTTRCINLCMVTSGAARPLAAFGWNAALCCVCVRKPDVAGRVTGARARCVQGQENKALFVPR